MNAKSSPSGAPASPWSRRPRRGLGRLARARRAPAEQSAGESRRRDTSAEGALSFARLQPVQEPLARPEVRDARRVHPAARRVEHAPLHARQLARVVGVGADDERDVDPARAVEHVARRVQPGERGVDLERGARRGRLLQHRVDVDLDALAGADPPAGRCAITCTVGSSIAARMRRVCCAAVQVEVGVHARHAPFERAAELRVVVDAAVAADVELAAVQEREARVAAAQRVDLLALGARAARAWRR